MKNWIVIIALTIGSIGLGCGGPQVGRADVSPGKMHAEGNFDGVFQSPAYGRMEFTVEGNDCVGLYEGERHFGRIQGKINGNLMTFVWTQWNQDLQGKLRESTGNGYFRYVVEEEKGMTSTRKVHRLKGEWGYGEDNAGNRWKAVKLSNRAKKILKPKDTKGASTVMDDDYAASAGFGVGEEPEEGAPGIEMSDPDEDKDEESDGSDNLDGLF